MENEHLIPADQFCGTYQIEFSFIDSLQQFGLIETRTIEQTTLIPQSQLQKLEQLVRLHYELNINLEGIDAITHLLERINKMQHQITDLKNELRLYSDFYKAGTSEE
jgi:chaperone modulatory protein CbpM